MLKSSADKGRRGIDPTSRAIPARKPKKCILSREDMAFWKASMARAELVDFIKRVAAATAGRPLNDSAVSAGSLQVPHGATRLALELDALRASICRYPPVPSSAQRFGNRAFRSWFAAAAATAQAACTRVLRAAGLKNIQPAIASELAAHLMRSFGNPDRLDFGTGHEIAFAVFTLCLTRARALGGELSSAKSVSKIGLVVESRTARLSHKRPSAHKISAEQNEAFAAMGLIVFPAYFRLVRELLDNYSLEPAGSRGAWSLDDYSVMPFILGAAQLSSHPHLTPRSALSPEVLATFGDNWIFLRAVKHLRKSKTGASFAEMSPARRSAHYFAPPSRVGWACLILCCFVILSSERVSCDFIVQMSSAHG